MRDPIECGRMNMSTLSREELFDACRAIYRTAGDNFMLPPLIRDVESPEENPRHTYYSLTDAECIRFIVELDEAHVGDNKFPLKKLPLRFRCELCDLDFREPPIALGEIETRALIRAFFLGVKVQIIANENRRTKNYNLRIQLSSTLFVECGELMDEDDGLTPETICNQVGLNLYSKSSDFFGSPQDGITVWRVRVAQELFGELKPAPEVFWPPEAEMAACRDMMRDALSAMTVAIANANPALATAPLRASAPILMDAPTNLTSVRREFFASGIAASLIIGVIGLASGYAFWGSISASPMTPTISARTASAEFSPEKAPAAVVPLGHALDLAALTPITQVDFGDASDASEQLPRATPPVDETPPAVVEAKPPLPRDFASAPGASESLSAAGAKPWKQSEILRKKKCAVVKAVSSHAGQGKSSVHRDKRNPANPLVVVGSAVNSFAARIAKDFRRIPVRLSSLIAGH
jgi:hypothetical protein